MSLLKFTKKGIYCPQADVYIDPVRKVKHAIVTHGHSDHAVRGHENYLCTSEALPTIRERLGGRGNYTGMAYRKKTTINGVTVSLHPAGHMLGSAQVRLEHKGEVCVVSGDYKLEHDGFSAPFEPVHCHTFVTESTFGLPIYRWESQQKIMAAINAWWRKNQEQGITSVLLAYSLGKAQRLIHNVDNSIGKIFTHGTIENMNRVIREQGIYLPETHLVTHELQRVDLKGNLVIAPPGTLGSDWFKKLAPFSVALASGWSATRKSRKNSMFDAYFVISDHADWEGLTKACDLSEAEKIYVTHGPDPQVLARWLCENGKNADIVRQSYRSEEE